MYRLEALTGSVELSATEAIYNEAYGYTLWENVTDPANPEAPDAIAMHLPAHSMSKIWELVESDYSETVELLHGSASLVVHKGESEEWTTMPLTPDNPTADGVVIEFGDQFCVVTDAEEAIVLSRPSKPFELSFEIDVTTHPKDKLSVFVIHEVMGQK